MKIQGEAQLIDVGVRDRNRRSVGRVVAVVCGPDPYTARWLVMRLRWRRTRRAVPAEGAAWCTGGDIQLPYTRSVIIASPAVVTGGGTADHRRRDAHYATLMA